MGYWDKYSDRNREANCRGRRDAEYGYSNHEYDYDMASERRTAYEDGYREERRHQERREERRQEEEAEERRCLRAREEARRFEEAQMYEQAEQEPYPKEPQHGDQSPS